MEIAEERAYRADWREAEARPAVPSSLPGIESPSLVELLHMTREVWDRWTRWDYSRPGRVARIPVEPPGGSWVAESSMV